MLDVYVIYIYIYIHTHVRSNHYTNWLRTLLQVVFMDCNSDCSNVRARSNAVHVPATKDNGNLQLGYGIGLRGGSRGNG